MKRHLMEIQRNLSIALASTDSLLEGLNLSLDACLQASDMDCGGIYFFDDATGDLNLMVHKGLGKDFVDAVSSYGSNSENVSLVKTGKPLYTIAKNVNVLQNRLQQQERLHAFASIPLFDKSTVIGCINLASHRSKEISVSSRLVLETIAAQVGSALVRMMSKKALQASEAHLRALMLDAEYYAIYRLAVSDSNPGDVAVVFVSPAIIDITGVAEPHNYETWFENIHADDRQRITRASLLAFETLTFDEVMRIYHPRKKEDRWIHVISKGVTAQPGEKKYVNGIIIDITKRKRVEIALVAKEKELEDQATKLKGLNVAMDVLLEKRGNDQITLQEQVLSNIKLLTIPYIEKLRRTKLSAAQETLISIIESSLHEIISPFSLKLSSNYIGLTPVEVKVADLVRQGKKTKEIAKIRNLSHKTVERHRENIRKKIGIKNKKINLESFLNTLR